MAASLVASLVLKLEDQLGGGLTKLTEQLDKLRNVGKSIGLPGLGEKASKDAIELARQIGNVSEQIYRMQQATREGTAGFESMVRVARSAMNGIAEATAGIRARVGGIGHSAREFGEAGANVVNSGLGAAAEGFAVYEPIKKYADQENIIRHIGITEGLSGKALDDRIAYLKEFFRTDALKTGQSSESIAQAYQDLVQMGIRQDVDKIIQAHSQAATAYNTTAEALGPAVGALVQTLNVPADQLGSAMAAMAQASKEGRFKIEDFSRELPGVAAQMALLGMKGRSGADVTFAALETVMRGSSNPSSAATGLTNVLEYIRTPFAMKHFEKAGVDLDHILRNGLRKSHEGTGNVLDELLDYLSKRTATMNEGDKIEWLGKLFHNQTAGSAVLTLMQQRGTYESLKAQLDKVDRGIVDRDTVSAINAPVVQLRMMGEVLEQIQERLGEGFLPVLKQINFAFLALNDGLKWAQANFPHLTTAVLAGTAGMLALGALLTLLGALVPLFVTGFGLVASVFEAGTAAAGVFMIALRFVAFALASTIGAPVLAIIGLIGALVAVLGAAAYDIYEHWDQFRADFARIWDGIKSIVEGAVGLIIGFLTFDTDLMINSLKLMMGGVGEIFGGGWDVVRKLFVDFGTWAESWAGGLAGKILAGIKSTWSELTGGFAGLISGLENTLDNSKLGHLLHLDHSVAQQANDRAGAPAASSAPSPGLQVNPNSWHVTEIHVKAENGTSVTKVTSSDPNAIIRAPVGAPARGATVSRP